MAKTIFALAALLMFLPVPASGAQADAAVAAEGDATGQCAFVVVTVEGPAFWRLDTLAPGGPYRDEFTTWGPGLWDGCTLEPCRLGQAQDLTLYRWEDGDWKRIEHRRFPCIG